MFHFRGWGIISDGIRYTLSTQDKSKELTEFEPYIEKFHVIQPNLIAMVKEKFYLNDVLGMAAEFDLMKLFKTLVRDLHPGDIECRSGEIKV